VKIPRCRQLHVLTFQNLRRVPSARSTRCGGLSRFIEIRPGRTSLCDQIRSFPRKYFDASPTKQFGAEHDCGMIQKNLELRSSS
jgi:hypothetical protein